MFSEWHNISQAPLRDFLLTWRRNTQIQMYWLWKWLESYNNCTFGTWQDKFLFNLLFWIPNSFCTFHYYGRGGTPSLASPDATSLIFYRSEFWATCACPEKQSLPWKFSLHWIYFLHSGYLSNLCLPWKTECALNLYWIYIFYHSEFWATLRFPWKTEFALKIFTA